MRPKAGASQRDRIFDACDIQFRMVSFDACPIDAPHFWNETMTMTGVLAALDAHADECAGTETEPRLIFTGQAE